MSITSKTSHARRKAGLHGATCIAPLVAMLATPQPVQAITLPAGNLVSVCSGVSLPPSTVTSLVAPLVIAGVTPVQNGVNSILGDRLLATLLGGLAGTTVDVDLTPTLTQIDSGAPITLKAIANNGSVIGPSSACYAQAAGYTLSSPAGIAIGSNAITGLGDTAASAASAGEINSIAFGNAAVTDPNAARSIAFGTGATITAGGAGGVALGNQARVAAIDGVALGNGAQATAANSVALGASTVAARGPSPSYTGYGLTTPQISAGEVSVGTSGGERQITNVAAGSAGTDAVNVRQLAAVDGRIGALAGLAVTYTDASHATIALGGGAGGTTITNLAPGAVSATSTDAVNGGQLYATNAQVTTNTADLASLGGRVTVNEGDIATLGTAVGVNTSAIGTLRTAVTNGGIGPVQYADAATPTVPNNGVPSDDLTLVGRSGGAVGLHNVAAGVLAASSTDAVNGGQLYATNQTVAGVANDLTAIDARVTTNSSDLATLSNSYASFSTSVINGGVGPLRYSNAATPTVPNNGVPSSDVTLVGGTAGPVKLHNVGDGSVSATSSDAINGSQFYALASQLGGSVGLAVSYDDATRARVTLGGVGATAPVALGNVAAGTLAATSTDAVNGGQLYATNAQVTTNTAGLSSLGGRVTANEGDIATLGTAVGINTSAIGSLRTAVTNGGIGPVQYADAATPTVPNNGVPSDDLTLVGRSGGAVGLHNVAAGTIATASTDAVNGGQLYATNQTIAGVANDLTAVDARVTTNSSDLAALSNSYASFSTSVMNGGVGPLRYSDAATPTVPNNGVPSSDVTLVGGTAGPVKLHNVGDGSVSATSSDAINGSQFYALASQLGGSVGLAVSYDDATRARVTLGGVGATAPVALGNVAAGTLAATSTDAVNGGQLYATNQTVAGVAAGLVGLDTRTTTNTTDIAAIDGRVGSVETGYSTFHDDVAHGAIGPVQYSNAGMPGQPNGGIPTNDLTLVGAAAAPVALHNVAAGVVSLTSTDAVNGGQFASFGGAVANTLGGMTYNPATNSFSGSFTYGGNQYASVQAALNAVATTTQSGDVTGGSLKYFHTNSEQADSRAGGTDSTAVGADAASAGERSVAMGSNAAAMSASSVAIGDGATARDGKAVSIGLGSMASGDGAVSIGDPNIAQGAGAVALGKDNGATGLGAIALGNTNMADGVGAASIGSRNSASGAGSVAIGDTNMVAGVGAIAIGSANRITGDNSLAIGSGVVSGATDTLAIGNTAAAAAQSALAVGNRAAARGVASIAVGTDSVALGDVSSSYGAGSQANGMFSAAFGAATQANAISSTAIGTGAKTTGFAGTALGSGAVASKDNSVALGAGVETGRGAQSGYAAFGLGDAQGSVGEIAVAVTMSYPDPRSGLPTPLGNRQITGVAAGSAAADAVNVAQLQGASARIGTALATSLGAGAHYDGATGAVSGPSYSFGGITYGTVGDAIQALASRGGGGVTASGEGPSGPSGNAVAFDGAGHDAITLSSGGTLIANVAPGSVAAGSTEAVNGAQLAAVGARVDETAAAIDGLSARVSNGAVGTVQYSSAAAPTRPNGGTPGNDVTLVGGDAAAPVGLHNVADGTVAPGSTDAVNGGQLAAANARVATAESTADRAMALGANSVQYDDAGHNSVTLGSAGGPAVALHDVAAGTSATDAVNLGQLSGAATAAVAQSKAYTDSAVQSLRFDLGKVSKNANAGTAGALALAGMPQPYEAGKGMIAMGIGGFRGQTAIAVGLSRALADEHTVMKMGATYNSRGDVGLNAGAGYQF